jgi:hypothetical protein
MENVPIVLGQYKLGKTLGIGAFGKVKCKLCRFCFKREIQEIPLSKRLMYDPFTLFRFFRFS